MLESAEPNGDIISEQTDSLLYGPKKFGTREWMGNSTWSGIVARLVGNKFKI